MPPSQGLAARDDRRSRFARGRPAVPRCAASGAACLLAALFAAGCAGPAPERPRTVVRLTTGTPGGWFQPMGEGLARGYATLLMRVDVRIQESAGSVANVEAIEAGEADIGFAFADVAYMASVGRLERRPVRFARLRGIAVLELAPVHLIVRAGSGIRDAGGLRGRRIGVGQSGSGTALTADLVLKAYGIDPRAVRLEPLRYIDAAARMDEGTLDGLFVIGSDPLESVRMTAARGARLLPLVGPAIDRLRREYPFLRPMVIPGSTYPGQVDSVRTIGVDTLLVCRRDLDEALVHDLTRGFFELLPTLSAERGALRIMDIEQAPATPIPLHEGAARYYREMELAR
jgi:TRAP transporter TAXI family solute receptor